MFYVFHFNFYEIHYFLLNSVWFFYKIHYLLDNETKIHYKVTLNIENIFGWTRNIKMSWVLK